jgi:hypothetical protein
LSPRAACFDAFAQRYWVVVLSAGGVAGAGSAGGVAGSVGTDPVCAGSSAGGGLAAFSVLLSLHAATPAPNAKASAKPRKREAFIAECSFR